MMRFCTFKSKKSSMMVFSFVFLMFVSNGKLIAAIMNYDNGTLTGISGLEANGKVYNVEFDDFSLADLTSGSFFIESNATAINAIAVSAQSLFESDTIGNGGTPPLFVDSSPNIQRGCESITCLTFFPHTIPSDEFTVFVTVGAIFNYSGSFDSFDTAGHGTTSATVDQTRGSSGQTLGRYALVPVPVPQAVWLLGTALLGFIGWRRRRCLSPGKGI